MNNKTKMSSSGPSTENFRQCLIRDDEGKMQRRWKKTITHKTSSIQMTGIQTTETSAVENRLRRLGINTTVQRDLPSVDCSSQISTPSNDKDERKIDKQPKKLKLSNMSIDDTTYVCNQVDDLETKNLCTDSSENEDQSPSPCKLKKDQPDSIEKLIDSEFLCFSPVAERHCRSNEILQPTSDCTGNSSQSDAMRGYFEIHLEEIFGNIIRKRRKTKVRVDGQRRLRETPSPFPTPQLSQMYYGGDGKETALELLSSRSRLRYVDLDRRRRQISRKSCADLKAMYEDTSFATDNLRPLMSVGKIVRFSESKDVHEKFWDGRVQALEQLTSQKMSKNSRDGKTNQSIPRHNAMHLNTLKGLHGISERCQKKIRVEEDSSETRNVAKNKDRAGDKSKFDYDHWLQASEAQQHCQTPGLIDYKMKKAERKLASLVGFDKDKVLKTLQDKKEKVEIPLMNGRRMRGISRKSAYKTGLQHLSQQQTN